MNDYILLMHDDVPEVGRQASESGWEDYIASLVATGQFGGGSTVGDGFCVRKDGAAKPISSMLNGYIRVQAQSLDDAKRFLAGNPNFEAGGTVEIRELPRS